MLATLRRTHSISANLIALILVCVLPVAALALTLFFTLYNEEQVRIQQDKLQTTRALISSFDREVRNTRAALAALSTSRMLHWGKLEEFHTQMGEVAKKLQVDSLVLIAPDGQIIESTLAAYGTPLPKLTQAPLLARTLKTRQGGVSDLFFGPITKKLIVTVSEPVFDGDEIAYVLNATYSPKRLEALLIEPGFPDAWRIVLADSTGHVVVRSHQIDQFIGKPVSSELSSALMGQEEGVLRLQTLEGIPAFAAFSRSRETRWFAAIAVPTAVANAPLHKTLVIFALIGTVLLMVGSLLAWLAAQRIRNSIRALMESVHLLGRGEKPVFKSVYIREIESLQTAIADAAMDLQEARQKALHDPLTGLGNRAMLYIVLEQQLAACQREGSVLSLLYIDLDGFKAVNDQFGHPAGDALLKSVGSRINTQVRDSDLVIRIGGDEFVVLLSGTACAGAQVIAKKLIEHLSQPYLLESRTASISASVGIATFERMEDAQALLQRADTALYHAKKAGKCCYFVAPSTPVRPEGGTPEGPLTPRT